MPCVSHAETTDNKRFLETHYNIRIYDKRAGKPLSVVLKVSYRFNVMNPPTHPMCSLIVCVCGYLLIFRCITDGSHIHGILVKVPCSLFPLPKISC